MLEHREQARLADQSQTARQHSSYVPPVGSLQVRRQLLEEARQAKEQEIRALQDRWAIKERQQEFNAKLRAFRDMLPKAKPPTPLPEPRPRGQSVQQIREAGLAYLQ
jgi:hypothetical protein